VNLWALPVQLIDKVKVRSVSQDVRRGLPRRLHAFKQQPHLGQQLIQRFLVDLLGLVQRGQKPLPCQPEQLLLPRAGLPLGVRARPASKNFLSTSWATIPMPVSVVPASGRRMTRAM